MNDILVFAVLLLVVVILTVTTNKLSIPASVIASIIAVLIFAGTGFSGIALLGCFFALGVGVTSWQRKKKVIVTLENAEKRDSLQVIANAGVAALLALIVLLYPGLEYILLLMIACSFSSATADTVSSELGVLYGKKCYNITTLKYDHCGENGVISIEGTLLGIAGSILIALTYCFFTGWNFVAAIIIIVAGTIGNFTDSFLGATLERKNIIGNNTVNFLNTFIAAAIGGVLFYLVNL